MYTHSHIASRTPSLSFTFQTFGCPNRLGEGMWLAPSHQSKPLKVRVLLPQKPKGHWLVWRENTEQSLAFSVCLPARLALRLDWPQKQHCALSVHQRCCLTEQVLQWPQARLVSCQCGVPGEKTSKLNLVYSVPLEMKPVFKRKARSILFKSSIHNLI